MCVCVVPRVGMCVYVRACGLALRACARMCVCVVCGRAVVRVCLRARAR